MDEKKTDNDILAEYVRERYPGLETSFDFILYRAAAKIKEWGKRVGDVWAVTTLMKEEPTDDVCDNELEDE
jgi:hypothetical protein